MRLAVFAVAFALALHAASADSSDEMDKIQSEYIFVPTSCETENCAAGGCLFENCANKLTCRGGLCYFRYVP
jgi:hypothetical protein